MRIRKNSDSPLNESQYSDLLPMPSHLDSSPHLGYKPICYYHKDQVITNFCRSPNCLLPLCPECVKLHATSHRAQGTHGEFDTLENTTREIYQDLARHETNFRDDELKFKDFLKLTSEYQILMQQKIHNAKIRLLELVESYFNNLSIDVERRVSMQIQRAQTESQMSLEKLKERQELIKEHMGNVRNQRMLKTTIHLLSSPFSGDQQMMHKEFQSLYNLLHSQKIDVLADENILHNININLLKYVNIHNMDLYKLEDAPVPLVPVQMMASTLKPQVIRSHSPVVISKVRPVVQQVQQPMQQPMQPIPLQNQTTHYQNVPVQQPQVSNHGVSQSQIPQKFQTVQVNHTLHVAPQARPNENELKASTSSKIHKVHPSIPGDPVIIDLNNQKRTNPRLPLTQSPPPVRVRSVSPTQMVRVVYNPPLQSSSKKTNQVYIEDYVAEREQGGVSSSGIKTTSKKRLK